MHRLARNTRCECSQCCCAESSTPRPSEQVCILVPSTHSAAGTCAWNWEAGKGQVYEIIQRTGGQARVPFEIALATNDWNTSIQEGTYGKGLWPEGPRTVASAWNRSVTVLLEVGPLASTLAAHLGALRQTKHVSVQQVWVCVFGNDQAQEVAEQVVNGFRLGGSTWFNNSVTHGFAIHVIRSSVPFSRWVRWQLAIQVPKPAGQAQC